MIHIPVLLQLVVDGLSPKKGSRLLDGTFGAGGHSLAIAEHLNDDLTVIAIDLDSKSLKSAVENFKSKSKAKIIHAESNFRDFDSVLENNHIEKVDSVILDLGFSSDQIENSNRGFSFQKDEPLLMTLKSDYEDTDTTALEIVNEWDEANLRDIIKYYGEERYAGRIAKAIVEARESIKIDTTQKLVSIIESAVPASYRRQKIHPATRTFQALRITVNDELESLRVFLKKIVPFLETEGRVAIISFHSLEDRIVKRVFAEWEKEGVGKRITKKPLIADEEERASNPRSRSAKLRIFEKTI